VNLNAVLTHDSYDCSSLFLFHSRQAQELCVTDSPHWVSVALFLRIERYGLESDNVPHLLPGLRLCGVIPPLPRMSSTGPLLCHFYPHTEQN